MILLTSNGLSSEKVFETFKKIVSKNNLKSAVIITTASLGKAENKYSILAKEQLESLGIKTEFYDFENDKEDNLSAFDIFYVCGGNTFKLLKFARQADFDKKIKLLLNRSGIYIGVSAGSIILGPSIAIASEINPDPNEVGLEDFTGFNLTNYIVFPHYEEKFEKEITDFETKNKVTVERLTNFQALLLDSNKKINI